MKLGAARRARYALRRNVRGVGERWPVYAIDATGRAREWAQVQALHGGFAVEWAGAVPEWAQLTMDREGFVDGFPFFLGDMRPQGFLGRQHSRRVADGLRLPADPRQWSDDDTLVFLQAEGDDMPGDLILGQVPMQREVARDRGGAFAMAAEARVGRYPELAAAVTAGGFVGSSAGGEQPKFLARRRREDDSLQAVLVKFTPPLESASGRRWADLLAAEAEALRLLAEHGLAQGSVEVMDAGGRRFLEVARHDRVGARGRRGVVSLEALSATFASGSPTTWRSAVETLAQAGVVDAAGVAAVSRLHFFGGLIGNTDMHFGNLSFWREDTLPFRPLPAYDMLPMIWAPTSQGEVVEREFVPPGWIHASEPVWREAADWAVEYWRRLAANSTVSPEFARRAREAGATVERWQQENLRA